jgi:hypothetical protein
MEYLIPVLLAAAAIAAVAYPLLARSRAATSAATVGDLEAEVVRFRAALRAGTVCARCTTANPAGSRFCSECGEELVEDTAEPADA